MNDYKNSISALLNGPDIPYKQMLINEIQQFNIDSYRENKSFLQINVRPLNVQQQKRLFKKQFKHYQRTMKNKCLHFTFPISYPCLFKSKEKSSIHSNSSIVQESSKTKRLKSAVSILFNDQTESTLPISDKNQSFNDRIYKYYCQSCDSFLSQGICSCIVHRLFQLNSNHMRH